MTGDRDLEIAPTKRHKVVFGTWGVPATTIRWLDWLENGSYPFNRHSTPLECIYENRSILLTFRTYGAGSRDLEIAPTGGQGIYFRVRYPLT